VGRTDLVVGLAAVEAFMKNRAGEQFEEWLGGELPVFRVRS